MAVAEHERLAAVPERTLPHLPGLDGLRGLAVAAVLAFHGGFSWMVGGFLGVSTFFTLSGFLITSLLLAEGAKKGTIGLRAFWGRRFRRLLPAALGGLALAIAFGFLAADDVQRRNLGGDVLASLADVANWRFVLSQQSYADVLGAPSPVLHFWSLAIEEQFYLVYPLIVAGALGAGALARHRARRPPPGAVQLRRSLTFALLSLTTVSVGLTLFAGFDDDRIYLGTDTRASELLVGALLAVVLFDPGRVARIARPGPWRRTVLTAGAVALAASATLWVRADQSSAWLYEGGFTIYAAGSAAVIAAAIVPAGPVAALLSWRPLRHLGRISYGVYVYHWPIFLWLRQRTELDLWPRFVVAVALTLAVAEVSYRYLELPIRQRRPVLPVRPRVALPVVAGALATAAVVVTVTAPLPRTDLGGVEQELAQLTQPSLDPAAATTAARPSPPAAPVAGAPPSAPPPRVALYGDSTALVSALGVASALRDTGGGVVLEGVTGLGCSIARPAERRLGELRQATSEVCNAWPETWQEKVGTTRPDVAVVQTGQWDIADIQLPGDDTWRGPGDPAFDAYLRTEMLRAVDTLSANGAAVVWFTAPVPGPGQADGPGDVDTSGRLRRFNELAAELPALRPGKVAVADLAGWVASLSPDEDLRMRPDGIHWDKQGAAVEAARRWMVPAILGAWQDLWSRRSAPGTDDRRVLAVGSGQVAELGRAIDQLAGYTVVAAGEPACGFAPGGQRRGPGGAEVVPLVCKGWVDALAPLADQFDPQVVVLQVGGWDLVDHQLAPDQTWQGPGDAAYDAALAGELARVTDLFTSGGATVVWVRSDPVVDPLLDRLAAPGVAVRVAGPGGAGDVARWLAPQLAP